MKNLLLVSMLVLGLISCKKEEDCNCGIITDYAMSSSQGNSLEIENNCTGNREWFFVNNSTWLKDNGEEHCFSDKQEW